MKRVLTIVLMSIVSAFLAQAQSETKASSSNGRVERQLIALERELSDALVREDAATLDRLWSDALVFTFPNGRVSSKSQRLARLKPATGVSQATSESSNTNNDVRVYPYGNTAVVTVLSTWKVKAGDQESSGDQYQATHVWSKQQGRWRLVAAHVSQVKK